MINNIKDNEIIPVGSARMIVFITLLMSLGFVLILFFFFLKDVFTGFVLIFILLFMLFLTIVSSLFTLRRLIIKILCPKCNKPFFSKIIELFKNPDYCAFCHKKYNK